MIFYLATLGVKVGLKVDIAKDEYGKLFKQKRLESLLRLSSPKLEQIHENRLKRIKSIDVLWHDGEKIKAEFEVEHSTSIVDAVVRGSNIKEPDILRVLVIPEEREDLVHRRFNEPAMQSMMKDMDWKVMTYKTLEKLHREFKKRKYVTIDEITPHTRKPIDKKQKERNAQ